MTDLKCCFGRLLDKALPRRKELDEKLRSLEQLEVELEVSPCADDLQSHGREEQRGAAYLRAKIEPAMALVLALEPLVSKDPPQFDDSSQVAILDLI